MGFVLGSRRATTAATAAAGTEGGATGGGGRRRTGRQSPSSSSTAAAASANKKRFVLVPWLSSHNNSTKKPKKDEKQPPSSSSLKTTRGGGAKALRAVLPSRPLPLVVAEDRGPTEEDGTRSRERSRDGDFDDDAASLRSLCAEPRYDSLIEACEVVAVEEVAAADMRVPHPRRNPRRHYATLEDDAPDTGDDEPPSQQPSVRRIASEGSLPRLNATRTMSITDWPIVLRDEDLLPPDYSDEEEGEDSVVERVQADLRQNQIRQRLAEERQRGIHHGPPRQFVPPQAAAGSPPPEEEERSWTEDITAAVRHILLSPKPPQVPSVPATGPTAAAPAATPNPPPQQSDMPVPLVQRLQESGLWPDTASVLLPCGSPAAAAVSDPASPGGGLLPPAAAAAAAASCAPLTRCADDGPPNLVGGCRPLGGGGAAAAGGTTPWSCTPDAQDLDDFRADDDADSLVLPAADRGAATSSPPSGGSGGLDRLGVTVVPSLSSDHPDDELYPTPQPPPRHRVRSLRDQPDNNDRSKVDGNDEEDDEEEEDEDRSLESRGSLVSGTESSYDDDDSDDYTEFRQPRHRRGCHHCGHGSVETGCSEHYAEFQKRRRKRFRERGGDQEFSMTQELRDLFSDCTYLFHFFGEQYLDGEPGSRSRRGGGSVRGRQQRRRRKRLGGGDDQRARLSTSTRSPSPRRVRSSSPLRRRRPQGALTSGELV